jgi:diguanylate cyclase (GGDEF)-like protein
MIAKMIQPLRPRWRTRPLVLLWATLLVLGLSIAATTVLLVLQLRANTLRQADRELRSFALILSDQAERSFEAVDIVQSGLFADLGSEGIRTPDDLRAHIAGIDVHNRLNGQGALLPQLDLIAVVDADGQFLNISHVWPPPKVNVADHKYFRELKSNPHQDVAISEPLVNRVTHTWAVVIAHGIRSPDGDFLGITFAGVLMSYFEKLYEGVVDRADMSVALLRNDGLLLAHYPHLEKGMAKPYPEGKVAGELARSIGSNGDETPAPSRIDGQDRLIAAHFLPAYPFMIAVSTSVESVLAPWHKQSYYLLGAAIQLELVLLGLGILLSRQMRNQSMLTEARAARAEAEAAKRGAEAEVALGHERERADREMRVQHVRLGAALGNMSQALCMFDATDRLVVANRRVAEMFGLAETDVQSGSTAAELRELLETRSTLAPTDVATIGDSILRPQADDIRSASVRELTDGRSLAVNFAPVEDDGWLVTLEDITERRMVEARIKHMAHHDALTGLPNRVLFHDRLSQAVARARRGESSAVLFLDLDHFKAVNDTLGHPVGDILLREVTQRLIKEVRETDTVARLGGDEFAIVQTKVNKPEGTATLATRIIDVISAPYQIDGHEVTIGTSIGIAVAPEDSTDPDQLLKNADMALYQAKAAGRGSYRHFEAEMDTRLRARRKLETDLRKAVADGELQVFYQPLLNLRTLAVCGFEALVRWFHPERGFIPPSEFVPVAEEIGLIIELGDHVLRRACRDAVGWPDGLKVAVNLSPIQLARRAVVANIADALRDSGLDPSRLELEITETAMIADTEGVLATLHQIRDQGVRIAMDDFGTGYSSLSYLLRFPFDKVKIDRSFIDGVGEGGHADVIVSAVIKLCTALGMTITAEGVETVQQLGYVASRQCTEAQGYLFSMPRPVGDVADMIRESEQQAGAALSITVAGLAAP